MQHSEFIILLFLTLLISSEVHSQDTSPRSLTWFQYKGAGSLNSGKFGAMLDAQHRRVGFLRNTSQHLIRPGVSFKAGEHLTLTIGTALFWHNISTENIEPIYRFEVRPYQFVQWRQIFSKFRLRHRFRFEQRFNRKTGNEQILEGFDFNYRIGYRLGFLYPLTGNVAIIASDELFINFGKLIVAQHLDQNRVYLGIRIKKDRVTFKTGYMWLIAPLPDASSFQHSHILRVGISHRW